MIKLYKGDNKNILETKLKQKKFNIIYLDPPYNTQNGNMSYFDKYENNKWISFFKERLKLIKELLEPKAVVYTSIGYQELVNAKLVLDEILGSKNFITIMPRMTNNVAKTTKTISRINDFVIVYKIGNVVFNGKDINTESYKLKDEHFQKRGFYQLRRLDYKDFSYSSTLDFGVKFEQKIYYPNDYSSFEKRKKNYTDKDWCWLWSEKKINFAIENDYLEVKNNKLYKKTYTKCEINKENNEYKIIYSKRKQPFNSLEFVDKKYINFKKTTGLEKLFSYPKNENLINLLFKLPKIKNKKILDPFAGTGISGIVANELNIDCTLIQIDEKTNENSLLKENGYKNLFDLTKEILKQNNVKLKIYE